MEKKFKNRKRAWILVLFVSIAMVWILASPGLETFFGINMPFVTINREQFNCFGYDVPGDKQLPFVLIAGLLLMLPARLVHLSMVALGRLNGKINYLRKHEL